MDYMSLCDEAGGRWSEDWILSYGVQSQNILKWYFQGRFWDFIYFGILNTLQVAWMISFKWRFPVKKDFLIAIVCQHFAQILKL